MLNRRLFFTKKARKDLLKLHEYVDQDNPIPAAKMVLKLLKAIDEIRMFARNGDLVHRDRPQYLKRIFKLSYGNNALKPLLLLYQVTDAEEIIVLRVIHMTTRWK